MEKLEIYKKIMEWEQENGENFLDQGFNLNARTFMPWLFGRNYINRDQFNLWVENMNTLEGNDATYYVYNFDGDYVSWAIVKSKEWNEEDQKKAYMILSEFISEIDEYIKRLERFINE